MGGAELQFDIRALSWLLLSSVGGGQCVLDCGEMFWEDMVNTLAPFRENIIIS